jgi:MFS transporter, ACS family, D-galactonate transporter
MSDHIAEPAGRKIAPAGTRAGATHKRAIILALLFVTVVINYLDRSNLSVAATGMARSLHLSPLQMGMMFSGFGWTYVALQIPSGWLVDRVAPRVLYPAALLLWSVATICLGFSAGFTSVLALRLLIGLFEAPSYPLNNRVYATWFPENERARAVGFTTSGQFVGLAFLTPVLAWLLARFGWGSVFAVTGAVGIVWAAIWFLVYREPDEFRGINRGELALLHASNRSAASPPSRTAASGHTILGDLRLILTQRKLIGLYLGQFGLVGTTWFFLTWFPTYLVTYRHLTYIKAGLFASLPFLAAFVGVISSGIVSDWLLRRGMSLGAARKLPIIAGMLLSTAILGANYAHSQTLVIACMTLAFFGNGFASITWCLVSAVAPLRLIGLTGGLFNLCGNLAAICIPLAIGALAGPHSFSAPILLVALNALMGAMAYIFVVGPIERVSVPN